MQIAYFFTRAATAHKSTTTSFITNNGDGDYRQLGETGG